MAVVDQWDAGGAYEPYVGRWSRLVASRFVEWLAAAPNSRWMDIGCGTGALTEAVLQIASPESVRGVDPSEEYVAFARNRIRDPRVEFAVAEATQLPPDDAFDFVVSGLVMNFVPDPETALREMQRVAASGGCLAAYVWDYAEGMEMLRRFWDTATELDPSAAALDEGRRFPLCHPEPLRALWDGAALRDVTVLPIEVETVFRDFDDYWLPFLGGQGPAPTYVASLSQTDRDGLKDVLRRGLPIERDGSIHLRARAWAVRGQSGTPGMA